MDWMMYSKERWTKSTTTYLNVPFTRWMEERGITWEDIKGRTDDLQSASIFPKVTSVEDLGILVRWMTSEPQLEEGKKRWLKAEKVSADEISASANLKRLYEQRNAFRKENWKGLAANYEKSVFYQLDLLDAANEFVRFNLDTARCPERRCRTHATDTQPDASCTHHETT